MVLGCFDRDAKLELQKEKASKKADGKTLLLPVNNS